MPTTPSHSLPYPDSTDPADVPADLAALAEAVDTKLDAIAPSQIVGPTAGQLLIANSSGIITGTAVTGDVTISNSGSAQIQAGAVGTAELDSDAVTTAKIDNNAVTAAKQPDGLYPPPGSILQYGGITAPTGWLLCNGDPYDRDTYAVLFGVIGTKYGAPSSQTFQVPDLRGRVPVGVGTHSDVNDLGRADNRTVNNRRPAHGHSGTALNGGAHDHTGAVTGAGTHAHSYSVPTSLNQTTVNRASTTANSPTLRDAALAGYVGQYVGGDGGHSHGLTINNGGAHSHDVNVGPDTTNTPAFVTVNFIIRAT